MNKEELYKLVEKLKLPITEYCILSGGSLVMHGIRENTNDLDIDITKKGFEIIKKYFSPTLVDENKKLYKIIENIERFLDNNFETDIEFIDGYPCQSLMSVYRLKKKLNRERDQSDIIAIKKVLNLK